MFEDEDIGSSSSSSIGELDSGTEIVLHRKKVRYGGKIVRDVGKYASGLISSGVGGVIDGFVEGMK